MGARDDWGRENEAVECVVGGMVGGGRMKQRSVGGRDDRGGENEAAECVMGGMIGGGRMKPVECGREERLGEGE